MSRLATLVQQCGWEPLLQAPLMLPEPRYFPDAWTPDEFGAMRLIRRFHRYYCLDALGAELVVYATERPSTLVHSEVHEGAAAYFAGIKDGVAGYGVDERQFDDPIAVTAAVAHEASHAFRFFHGLALSLESELQEEERLTDLTTVFLGAGVLTANATEQFSSGAIAGQSLDGHRWSVSRLGYLSPEAMCFALAVVVSVRGLSKRQRGQVRGALHPNHAKRFQMSVAWLEENVDDLREVLGLSTDAAPCDDPEGLLAEMTAPFEDEHFDEDEGWEGPATDPGPREADIAFRVLPGYERLRFPHAAATVAGVASVYVFSQHVAGALAVAFGFAVAVVVLLGVRGAVRRFGAVRCSNCTGRVTALDVCPECGAAFHGTIRSFDERLAAQEEFEDRLADVG